MQNKIKALLALLFICMGTAFADEGAKPVEPKKGRILVVGRLEYAKPIDIAAREEGFKSKGKALQIGKVPDFWFQPDFNEKIMDSITQSLDGYFYAELKPSKNGTVYLKDFSVGIFGKTNWYYQFKLPGGVLINVPDDAVYLYVGTFEYDLDYALRTVGFRHIDDYDRAKKDLCRDLGKNVDLYRGELKFTE